MHALSDEQQMDRLEKRVDRLDVKIDALDKGLAAKPDRTETRAEFRTLLTILLAIWVTMVFGLVGILLQLS